MSTHSRTIHKVFFTPLILSMILAMVLPPVGAQASAPLQEEFPAPKRPIHNGVDKVEVKVGDADNKGLSVTYTFPDPHVWQVEIEGDEKEKVGYVQIAVPGMEQAYAEIGKPAIPFYSRLLALPEGASVEVVDFEVSEGKSASGLLYPAQEEPIDTVNHQEGGGKDDEKEFEPDPAFEDKPFTINDDFYKGTHTFPETPVAVEVIGAMGNLNLARVSVATAAYSTSKMQTKFYKSVSFRLKFEGGEDHFLTQRDMVPFNRPDDGVLGLLLNGPRIFDFLRPGKFRPLPCLGDQYLIVTDPLFRSAADTLATAKRTAGLSTRVVETGNGAQQIGTSRTAIKSYIQDRYDDDCSIQLKYVLLLGDAEFIPVWYNRTYGSDTPGSDLEYTLLDSPTLFGVPFPDIIPDVALGRIPVDTLAQANGVVNKIVAYEQTPPTQASFYEDVTLASYFQCCRNNVFEWGGLFNPIQRVDGVASRSFVETSELVHAELSGEGYNLKRIYTSDDDYHDTPTRTISTPVGNVTVPHPNFYNAATRDITPRKYYNQAPLPSAIGPNSNFAWDGDRNDIIDAVNDGTFLLIHRDHGYKNGWGDPSFTTFNHGSLTNGNKTPVVYSINCSSGLFDNETLDPAANGYNYNVSTNSTYWAEDLLRRDGGAVAVIGDTRNSPSWANSAFLRGLVDATWPGTVPEGGLVRTRRMGKILNYAKVYLLGQVGVSQTAGSISNNVANGDVLMYHLFGDPTMKMWKENPHPQLLPDTLTALGYVSGNWTFSYPQNGATITAMQGGNSIGLGTVENGSASLQFLTELTTNAPVSFIANYADSVAVTLPMQQLKAVVTKDKGGEFSTPDKNFNIGMPPNAVATDTELILTNGIASLRDFPKNHTILHNFVVDAVADGEKIDKFAKPFLMNLCVDTDQQKNLKAAFIAYFDEKEGRWVALKSDVDTKNGCVSAEVDHLTEFALLRDDSLSFGDDDVSIFLPFVTQ